MMKYLLLLILLLLSNEMIRGTVLSSDGVALTSYYSIHSDRHIPSQYLNSVQNDTIRTILSNAFVVAAKDSFPLQVGAFKFKSNAEKFSRSIQHMTETKVKIIMEDGLYKVRIARMTSQSEADHNDSIKRVLNNAFVVSSKDTFPLQVGAFKYKSNADRMSLRMKNLSDVKVKIYIESGFYKVRINRLPSQPITDDTQTRQSVTSVVLNDTVSTGTITDKTLLAELDTSDKNEPGDSLSPQVKTQITPEESEASEVTGDTTSARQDSSLYSGNSPWLKRIKYFGESYILVNALIVTILISIGTMITLLFIILLNRRKMEKEEKLRQYLMEKYQSLIVDYLYGSATPHEFRAIASDNYRRQVLIEQMIDVSVNLKGEESKKLIGLYKHLGLDRDSLDRAHDYRWHKKIKGFRELAFMNIRSANDSILKAVNSSNEILRMEAQIALVRLSDNDHFKFLSHLKRPFSLWEQITLHDLIIQHNIPVPEFKRWLPESNTTVVLFALRMIREFKQLDAEEDIKIALQHSSQAVRHMAVQVAGDLHLIATLEIMKRMYKNQDYKTCLEIVRSMGKVPDKSMLGFLKLVLDKEDDVQLQIEATKSIEKMGEEGVKALVKIMKSEYKNYSIIVRHVLDRRIN